MHSTLHHRCNTMHDGNEIKPQNDEKGKILTEFEIKKSIPDLQLPAVWLPHGILGISNSEIVKIPENTFGPFEGQLLVCDQGQSMIDRVFMEKVNGEYQGAAWAFRSGFQSGIVRLHGVKTALCLPVKPTVAGVLPVKQPKVFNDWFGTTKFLSK